MSTSSYRYRSRYSQDEASSYSSQNNSAEDDNIVNEILGFKLLSNNNWCWNGTCILLKWTCSTKRRLMISTGAFIILSVLLRHAGSIFQFADLHSTHMSSIQSYGYVTEPKWKWQGRQQFLESVRSLQAPSKSSSLSKSSTSSKSWMSFSIFRKNNNNNGQGTTMNDWLPQTPLDIPRWYETHWKVDFTCPTKERIVGSVIENDASEVGKWYVCNPNHIQAISEHKRNALKKKKHQKGCLIYTSVRPNGLVFEKALLDRLQQHSRKHHGQQDTLPCDIHVFDPTAPQEIVYNHTNTSFIHIHPWGFGGDSSHSNDQSDNKRNNMRGLFGIGGGNKKDETQQQQQQQQQDPAKLTITSESGEPVPSNNIQLKTFTETVDLLGHNTNGQTTIDLLVLDCAGCEWQTYQDWINPKNVDISEILLHVHGAPPDMVNDMFTQLQKQHYVTYHKQASIYNGLVGQSQFYSFLKLKKDFFMTSSSVDAVQKGLRQLFKQ